jgi:hypothetical protein
MIEILSATAADARSAVTQPMADARRVFEIIFDFSVIVATIKGAIWKITLRLQNKLTDISATCTEDGLLSV